MSKLTNEQLQQAYDSARGGESIDRLRAVADAAVRQQAAYELVGEVLVKNIGGSGEFTITQWLNSPPENGTKLYMQRPVDSAENVVNLDGRPLTISGVAKAQYEWVERVGWHNKTVLESLALISGEVGEAVNECRGDEPTEKLGEELADIILRVLDLTVCQRIDIDAELRRKMAINESRGTRGRRI